MAILRGCRLRPVEAARPRSQQRAALGGKVSDVALANNSASRIVKRYAWIDPRFVERDVHRARKRGSDAV